MKVSELLTKLEHLNPEDYLSVQVVAEDGSCWNCWLEVNDILGTSLVQLRITHPELKTLKDLK